MKEFLLYNTQIDNRFPGEFRENYHIHLLCKGGSARFMFNDKEFFVKAGDLMIWQMSSEIYDISYADDFDADFLLASGETVGQFNPEMVWAVKGFIFIKLNPVFHLSEQEYAICQNSLDQFRFRLSQEHIFKFDVLGRLFQIFLFDMWNFYSREIDKLSFSNTTAQIFLRFLNEVAEHCTENREVAYYSDLLCLTPKYLSEVCKKASNVSASEWIGYHTRYELVRMLSDRSLSLMDISDKMNFCSQSHFSRYVKRLLGVSPKEFREKLDKETAKS